MLLLRAAAALGMAALAAGCDRAGAPADTQANLAAQWPLLEKHCYECHDSVEQTAGLALDKLGPESIGEHAEVWEKVVRKLRGRLMPPPGGSRPDSAAIDALVASLETSLDQAAPQAPPGRLALHRLNRTEYANAVRDLLALDVEPSSLLPADDPEDGFDNIANSLQVSPSFIEQYLSAARNLSAQAVGTPSARPVGVPYTFAGSNAQQFHVEGLPLGTRGGALIEHYFPSDGEYELNIGDLVTGLWVLDQEHVNTLIATLDGDKFFELDIGGGDDLKALDTEMAPAVDRINAQLKKIPFTTTAGVHKVGVTFLHRSFAESDRQLRSLIPGAGQDAVLAIRLVEIFGPVKATGISRTASRDKIFSCYPTSAGTSAGTEAAVTAATTATHGAGGPAEATACAREIVARLANEAFRGTANDEDIAKFMALYERGAAKGGFEEGVQYALSGVLAYPKFLYRIEGVPEDLRPGSTYALGGSELASRLSFFLWSTIPDEELRAAAAAGELETGDGLERQVRRMLADRRSLALASNFAYQWLGLGKLDNLAPDPEVFGDVDRDIREHLTTEARMFVDSIFREDRSVLDLLTAKHSYLNEPLALHYGINDIRGKRFRRVDLTDETRWGLLGKGGVLMVSSYPNRTSPVLRGQWVMKTLLGTPPTEPPPDVEALVENVVGQAALGVRERLEVHRANPSCNGCHGVMDPLGFALENFDAVGRWRDKDREAQTPIDSSGVLADGTPVDGPIALRQALLERPDQFVQALIERLMTYGLGRKLEHGDMPTVRRIVREAASHDYRFSSLVLGIVNSPQFQMKAPVSANPDTLSASAAAN
jgi:hypothetical protein